MDEHPRLGKVEKNNNKKSYLHTYIHKATPRYIPLRPRCDLAGKGTRTTQDGRGKRTKHTGSFPFPRRLSSPPFSKSYLPQMMHPRGYLTEIDRWEETTTNECSRERKKLVEPSPGSGSATTYGIHVEKRRRRASLAMTQRKEINVA